MTSNERATRKDGSVLLLPRWRVGHHPEATPANIEMCITPDALKAILLTVGRLPPETGGKGFGPGDLLGFDAFEFDEVGSARSSGSIYRPDEVWGELEQRQRRLQIMTPFCTGCAACVDACTEGGLHLLDGKAAVDKEACVLCGYCAAACPEFIIRVV